MKSRTLLVVNCLFLASCDSMLRIQGTAPTAQSCLLHVIDGDTGQVANTFSVSGPFEERIIFGGVYSPDFVVSIECNGKLVKSIPEPEIRNGELNIGNIEP
jgi:hypothetical protein